MQCQWFNPNRIDGSCLELSTWFFKAVGEDTRHVCARHAIALSMQALMGGKAYTTGPKEAYVPQETDVTCGLCNAKIFDDEVTVEVIRGEHGATTPVHDICLKEMQKRRPVWLLP